MQGVTTYKTKKGITTYRANITYHSKHVSLGSYLSITQAHLAYTEACAILASNQYTIDQSFDSFTLYYDKIISLLNYRDHNLYIKTPIYLHSHYFDYYLAPDYILKFDLDDLFYLSTRKIMKRGHHLFVADYGMQVSLRSRFGIKNYAIEGNDYCFSNNDSFDYRRSNLIIYSHYHGVHLKSHQKPYLYSTSIHVLGDLQVGLFDCEIVAAIAYNKAADLLRDAGCSKNFPINFIEEYSAEQYANYYHSITLQSSFTAYLSNHF